MSVGCESRSRGLRMFLRSCKNIYLEVVERARDATAGALKTFRINAILFHFLSLLGAPSVLSGRAVREIVLQSGQLARHLAVFVALLRLCEADAIIRPDG